MMIPIMLRSEIKEAEVSIIHANMPFLLGRDHLNKWNCELMFKENSLIINKVKKFKLEANRQGHIILKLLDNETETKEHWKNQRGQKHREKEKTLQEI